MSEMLTGPKKIVDGLTEVFRGLTQMCEGMAERSLRTMPPKRTNCCLPKSSRPWTPHPRVRRCRILARSR